MTAYTEVGICNLSLKKLSSPPISSIVAPTTTNERRFYDGYPHNRDIELTKHTWLFSLARQQGTPLSDIYVEDDGYNTAYSIPVDCLRPLQSQKYPWRRRGNILLTPFKTGFFLDYIARKSVGEFDALFVEVLACKMAWEFAFAITNSTTTEDLKKRQYEEAVSLAKRANAIQKAPQGVAENEANFSWLNDRYS